ncbi:MAG: adenylyl-sulfate kinase [Perlabentimonas sp.]
MQNPFTIWLTGLPSSGKTTLAEALHNLLKSKGVPSVMLDGDSFRRAVSADLGFSLNDRQENIRRVANVAKIINESGVVVICSFISPTEQIRDMAKTVVGENYFFEVHVNTPLEVCKERDAKGMYKKAKEGIIEDFTGVNSPYEPPISPNLTINTATIDSNQGAKEIFNSISQKFF